MCALKLQSRDLYSIMQSGELDANATHQAYNALDSAVTLRVWENLRTRIAESPHAQVSYNFSRAMQGPAMDMMKRGVAIQAKVRQDETERFLRIKETAQDILNRLADAVWGPESYTHTEVTKELYTPIGKRGTPLSPRMRTVRTTIVRQRPLGLNASSDKQCLAFFNTALGFPVEYEIRKTPQGTIRTPSANAKALRKWAERRTKGPGVSPRDRTIPSVKLAAPFVSLILTIREADKMLAVLRTPLDPDGRMRCSYNVAATENWRWSSSKNVYGRGTNLQNITPSMRRMFCADDGYRFISTDLEQAESYVTAVQVWLITGDDTYWNAILSGDLHTQVCRMAWPELPWTGDFKADRVIADQDYPGLKYSYRDVSKRIGHGCVTPDHEVLTWSGWVPISSKPAKILCMDYDQEAEWLEVDAWNEFDFDGEMLHFKGTSVDQLVTPNHRMIFSRDPGGTQVLREIRADEWDDKGSIPLGDYYNGTGQDSVSPAEARMIAAIQADGWVSPRGKPEFHFHKERKFERLEKLCQELGVSFKRCTTKTYVDYMMQFPKEAGAYLLDWDYPALKAYSDEHRYWDGHVGKTAISISSKNRTHLEWIQTINRLIGKGGNIQKPKISGFGTTMYTLQENNRKWAARASMTRTPVPYKGKVYCPTVKTGMFFIRRDGKISVTGNSNYDGSAFGIAQAVGIPFDVVQDFQLRYFTAFPAIREYHKWVRAQIREHQYLDTPLLQRRYFFGRPTEDATFREAIACVPQGTVGSLLNLVMWRVWQRSLLDPFHSDHIPVQLLLQNHDAFLSQSLITHSLPSLIHAMNTEFQNASIPVTRGSDRRLLTIPGEFVTGFNWAYADKGSDKTKWTFADGNPDGLRKWSGADDRVRQQGAVARPGDWLNRPLSPAYR